VGLELDKSPGASYETGVTSVTGGTGASHASHLPVSCHFPDEVNQNSLRVEDDHRLASYIEVDEITWSGGGLLSKMK